MNEWDIPRAIIARLGLEPHPEGGWYRESWRAPTVGEERASATMIWFLLEAGQRSHWHRVDATEIWLWHSGSPLRLSMAAEAGAGVEDILLGGDLMAGELPQYIIPPNYWQAAESDGAWTLVSCAVSPGFEFAGFSLAPPGWHPATGIDG